MTPKLDENKREQKIILDEKKNYIHYYNKQIRFIFVQNTYHITPSTDDKDRMTVLELSTNLKHSLSLQQLNSVNFAQLVNLLNDAKPVSTTSQPIPTASQTANTQKSQTANTQTQTQNILVLVLQYKYRLQILLLVL